MTRSKRSAKPVRPQAGFRTSDALREILTKNPKAKTFTVAQIVGSIADSRAERSLMLFSIPGMLPIPGASDLVGLPASAIAGHMMVGKTEIKLPKAVLNRSVPRRSLAVAIHAILPLLERAEKALKPRWRWATHPAAQKILGLFLFVLALAIAVPFLGFTVPHSAAMFMISLGLAEQDGAAIMIGVIAGLASLTLMAASSFSEAAMRSQAGGWLKKVSTSLGLRCAAALLGRMGCKWARLLTFPWSELMLLWNPEASSRSGKLKKTASASAKGRAKSLAVKSLAAAPSAARRAHKQARTSLVRAVADHSAPARSLACA